MTKKENVGAGSLIISRGGTPITVDDSTQLIPDEVVGHVYMTFVMMADVTQANANSYAREEKYNLMINSLCQ